MVDNDSFMIDVNSNRLITDSAPFWCEKQAGLKK